MKGFFIRQLCLRGIGKEDAIVKFDKGANIISGPSNTGKTFIFECIEYMLGKTDLDRKIKESLGYSDVFLEIGDYSGGIFTLRSDFNSGDYFLYNKSVESITQNDEFILLKRKHEPGKTDTLSNFILKKCNLDSKFIRTNASGKKRELSLRDLRILYLVDELKVPTKESPFLTGQVVSKTAEENVLKLLLTGVDDSEIVEAISGNELNNKKGRLEFLNELIKLENEKIKEGLTKDEVIAQKEKLDIYYSTLISERDEIVEILQIRNVERERISVDLNVITNRKEELEKLYNNSFIIMKQYISDKERLKSTIEVGNVLSSYSKIECPICHSEVEKKNKETVSTIALSAAAELKKIDGLINELMEVRKLFCDEIKLLTIKQEKLSTDYEFIDEEINQDINERYKILGKRIAECQETERMLSDFIKVHENLELFNKQRESLDGVIKNAKTTKNKYEVIDDSLLSDINENMLILLKEWGYPEILSVTYNDKKKDFLLSNENRNLAGKGLRAISYSSFIFSLINFTVSKAWNFGLCIIDSPLVTYRKPDVPEGEAISEDMVTKFYKSLCKIPDDRQIIIIENEELPEEVEGKVNHIHFTKNINFGRYGFIPKVSNN
ncbi:TPA: hypothetical protein KEY91_002721 [Proteus mirabilis]|uniref:hypothetical protein n=3 Tax=Proteus mirabilis TaxID=584 RepID=UPI000283353E|nr:hypothetical protein [Proteus mirabilis]EJD6084796.1 hypothetical protein [Proteus mirabilis]EKA98625.1 hypothetical protein HMPREF1310_01187 [Proteus mirabilis WGLW4]ELT8661316.1 hypothetical protein [Proteus mirabilis]KAB7721729.1 hypothetical protein GBN13_10705 [Proteus mirabilis]MBG2804876.1 hypothetical protein [Proteus mirabilis]